MTGSQSTAEKQAAKTCKPPAPNKTGRRGGRGLRPWLLMPKVMCVGLMLGGLAAAAVVLNVADDATPAQMIYAVTLTRTLFQQLIVPALLTTLALGCALLFFEQSHILVRLRWLQVKLVLVVLFLPTLHLMANHQMQTLRQHQAAAISQLETPDAPAAADDDADTHNVVPLIPQHFAPLRTTVRVALAGVLVLVLLGRLKPKFGQNWARSYPRTRMRNARRDRLRQEREECEQAQSASPPPTTT